LFLLEIRKVATWLTELMEKPTTEQLVWVFQKLKEHLEEGGSFRDLIYDRLGLDHDDYEPICEAGGKEVADALDWIQKMSDLDVEVELEESDIDNDDDEADDDVNSN